MFALPDGRGVSVGRPAVITDTAVERARDLIILRLRAQRPPLSYRKIAGIVGMNHTSVRKRIEDIPPQVKRYYGA